MSRPPDGPDEHAEVVVVGAGIVGLATAWQLVRQRPGARVVVLERGREVGGQQSSRNSGVLHAGLYYPPGSAKARWCRAGKAELEEYLVERGLPLARTGKLVVAVHDDEVAGLRALEERARTNGVRVERVGAAGLRDHEPHVTGVAGLFSPDTAVTDFAAVCRALAADVTAAGGSIHLDVEVEGLEDDGRQVTVRTSRGVVRAPAVVACTGLSADRMAALSGPDPDARVVPFRGAWLRLRPDRTHLVRGNIYPVPVGGGLPFLGVHLTRRVDGQVWIGPNALLALARTGRRPWSVSPRDLADALSFAGLWRLGARHWRTGIDELWREVVIPAALREVRRYVPDLRREDVRRGPWGVRAQLLRSDGTLVDDFDLRTTGRVVHLLNAPSPAATSALVIGRELARRVP